MRLKELIEGIYQGDLPDSLAHHDITAIATDSRYVQKDNLFVALKGHTHDGQNFVDEAVTKGAAVVVYPQSSRKVDLGKKAFLIPAEDTNRFLQLITPRFYGNPSRQVKTIGITGTNGKTTVSYLLESIYRAANKSCGVVGTINYRIGEEIYPAPNTTPGFLQVYQFLARLAKKNIAYAIMEVSSHGLKQGRVKGIDFHSAVFTNLTSEHLDYHGTMEDYFLSKAKLFTGLGDDARAVINIDDLYGRRLTGMTKAKMITYGLSRQAQVTAGGVKTNLSGCVFTINLPKGKIPVTSRLTGTYNVYNILAAAALAQQEGFTAEQIQKGIAELKSVPGRLEMIKTGKKFHVFIDYAHTADALEHVLTALREFKDKKILLVFGCGGDRDKTKRPRMGEVADRLADFTILTSDNPRSEDPESIVSEITTGLKEKQYAVELDREKAIHKALDLAQAGDMVLIAGKGHETYQILKDKTIHCDDHEIIRRYLKC